MPRLILSVLLLPIAAVATLAGPVALRDDPFPIGTCVNVSPASPEPTCVIVDPTP